MTHLNQVKSAVLFLAILLSTNAFSQKKKAEKTKAIEGRKFQVLFYEMKPAGRGKAIPDFIEIRKGGVVCNLMEDKLAFPPTNSYIVTLDSTYTEDETENRIIEFESTIPDGDSDFKWQATITNYDIEGIATLSKKGIEKKRFEFAGTEKTKSK